MMITIHGLPITTKYQDLKILIKKECNINDFILDCLVSENDGTKKVRVGLTDDSEGNHVMKCLNGYRMSGHILKLMPVGKSASANIPQQRSFEARDNYQGRNEYPSHGFSDRNKVVEPQTAPWAASNQWSNQPANSQIPSNYSYQQPTNTAYGQQANPSIKPQFEPRINISTARVPQQTPSYGYNPKSNLISLGPQRNLPPTLREIPEANRPIQSRYSNQNYENQSEKPVTIMKDNFQGPAQYNVAPHTQGSGTYQTHNQPSPWAFQQAQKQPALLDKKPYDDRKYPQPNQMKPMVETPKESAYQGYDKSRQYSPQRRAYERDIQPERRASPTERHILHSGRNTMPGRISPTNREAYDRSRQKIYSPDRHISPNRAMHPGHISPSTGHMVTGKRISPSGRRISPGRHVSASGRQISPPGRRISPSGRRISPSGRRISPTGRRILPSDGRISPSGRRISPSGRRISPSGRRISPSGRRISPSGRRISPSGRSIATDRNVPHGRIFTQFEEPMPSMRAISPGRKMSPSRKISPSHRRLSPQAKKEDYMRSRRISPPSHSPMDRRMPSRQSPNRGMQRSVETHSRQESSRGQTRYSPSHQFPEKSKDYPEDRRSGNIKSVRPAYESPTQASNEAIYSGGYRPNVRDVQYPTTHTLPRQDWQDREKAFPPKTIIEDRERRDVPRLQKFDIHRISDQQRPMEQETKRSRSHSSRSPRRDRSPIRDRYRRHSPSPRSPRRSWALEKRRSPQKRETPPPPVWPGNNSEDYSQQSRPKISAREVEKHVPVWETRDKRRDDYTTENRRNFEEQIRMKKEMEKWKPIPQSDTQESSRMVDEDRIHKESKFVKKEFETRRDYREDDMRKSHTDKLQKGYQRQDREDIRYKSEHEQKDDIPRKREEYAGRIEEKKKEILQKQEQLQKEIDEVYKRAVDFTKKAELYRKSEHKKDSYDSDRDRDRVSGPKNYERSKQDSYEKQSRNVPFQEHNRSYASRIDKEAEIEQSNPADVKAKRNKAILEISEKIMHKYGSTLPSEMHRRIHSELKWTLNRRLNEMFGKKDVSFIEIIVKFNSSHSAKDEKNMFDEIMYSMSGHVRNAKRTTQDDSDVPAKMPRRSPQPNLNNDQMPKAHDQQSVEIILVDEKSTIKERPDKYRENSKPKLHPEKKQLTTPSKSSERTPLKRKSEKEDREEQKSSKYNQEDEEEEAEAEGQFELNELMTRVLKEELEALMIEVWRTLPDMVPTEIERYVAEKLRNEASDDLTNVLGLNITKRLLNVYNPLFVKLKIRYKEVLRKECSQCKGIFYIDSYGQFKGITKNLLNRGSRYIELNFTCRPESGCLTKFLDQYNVTSFKRINKETNTFAARLRSITDFDNICAAKIIKCGGSKITVTPCYKFTHCPRRLNTIFAEKGEDVIKDKEEDKLTNESEGQEKPEKNKLVSNKNEEKSTTVQKEKDVIEPKETPNKHENKVSEKVAPKEKQKKDMILNSPEKKKIESPKEIKIVKPPVVKPKPTVKETPKEKQTNIPNKKSETKRIAGEGEINESEINKFNEGEEMNDDEIIALISSGVIVDECIASDGE